jgi:transposase-like protein
MSGRRRRRLDAGTWREVMRRFEAAGATVSEFCAREGLNESSFYRWRTRVGAPSGVPVTARSPGERTLAVRPSAASFIELGSLAGSRREAGNSLELRLDLGGGVVLQIVRR